MEQRARIGTSGFEYAHWRDDFYAGVPRTRWLERYSQEFDTVELNATFYRLPAADAFDRWAARVPDSFRFAVKASRYLTHMKRLREPHEPIERLWRRASRLERRFGPVLYQLPPRWKPNLDRLQAFLAAIPPDHPQAIEIRDDRWYGPEAIRMLRGADVALCLHDMPGSATRPEPVGPFVYLRFHGAGGEKYGGRYPSQRLAAWADRIGSWVGDGLPVWAYFNNDIGGHAVRDAARLREMVARRGVRC